MCTLDTLHSITYPNDVSTRVKHLVLDEDCLGQVEPLLHLGIEVLNLADESVGTHEAVCLLSLDTSTVLLVHDVYHCVGKWWSQNAASSIDLQLALHFSIRQPRPSISIPRPNVKAFSASLES